MKTNQQWIYQAIRDGKIPADQMTSPAERAVANQLYLDSIREQNRSAVLDAQGIRFK